jgi:hypothetical protein
MDNNTLTTAGLASTFTILAGLLYKIYMVVNHKRIRSNCCGKKLEASLDIENTTPPHEEETQSTHIKLQRKLQVQIPSLDLEEINRNTIRNPMNTQ